MTNKVVNASLSVLFCVGIHAVSFAGTTSKPTENWDWTIIIGTGQSLAVGGLGIPVKTTVQPFGNLKLDSADLKWPVDPNDPKLTLVPLIEPAGRHSVGFPNSWPTNIDGETTHTSAANQISYLVQQKFHRDYVTIHFEVGEAGQGMIRIRKNPIREGVSGRAYEASMIQTKAINRLAKAAGKSCGVGAVFLTHGESDTGNPQYGQEMYQLWKDYNADAKAITGQKSDLLLITSQHNRLGDFCQSTTAQWKAGVDYPDSIVCACPKYQYTYGFDSLHMNAESYRLLGEKYGEVYYERVVLGHKWLPLEPLKTTRKGNQISIKFHVPNKPLVWDSTLGSPHPSWPEWANGKGFEVADRSGKRVTIQSAGIRGGDTVVLELASDPGDGARLSYAMVGEPTLRGKFYGATPHWGILRDSDPFVGYNTHVAQPNFCVAFDITLP